MLRDSSISSMQNRLQERKYFLVDNGSLDPEAVKNLRLIADQLQKETNFNIRPMGLMHSHKIPPSSLDGIAGESIDAFLRSEEAEEFTTILILPFFFGPSRAFTAWLPERLKQWAEKGNKARSYRILDCLHQKGDDRIARVLAEHSMQAINETEMQEPYLALVDHGTPVREVNFVREEIGTQLQAIMSNKIKGFSTCCMERRPEKKYDFNEPLLATLLDECSKKGMEDILVAQLFLSPGRHAGKNGDLARICSIFEQQNSKVRVIRTELLGKHPLIREILLDRLHADFEGAGKLELSDKGDDGTCTDVELLKSPKGFQLPLSEV